jgi:hypothetical protein
MRIAKGEADAAKAAEARADHFIRELMKDFDGIEAMMIALRDEDPDAIRKILSEFKNKVVAQEREPRSNGGKSRAQGDPRTDAKDGVFGYWVRWQRKPSYYKSKAEFAKDMLEKFGVLTSVKVIENWCRDWEKLSIATDSFNRAFAEWKTNPRLHESQDEFVQTLNEKSPYIRENGLRGVLHLLEQIVALNNRNSPEPNRNPTS